MDRLDLVPASHREERLALLDVLAGRQPAGAIDAEGFLAVAPRSLYPFLHRRITAPEALPPLFAQHYRQNALLHLRRVADLRRIGDALSSAGIDFLVLKGPVLAATAYDDPAARTMLDLDLLVHDLEPAMAALTSLGYTVPERFAGVPMNDGDAPPLWCGEPGAPIIELHALLDSAPDDPAALESAWSAARAVEIGHGLVVRTLAPGEFVAHVIMHLSRHHRFEGELRSLLDVALLLRSPETASLDWAALAAEWERRGIAGWIGLTLALANRLLDIVVPEPLQRFQPEPEAVAIAAEQLWIDKDKRVSGRITQLFTRQRRAPLPMRPWQSARNVLAALRNGTLRPRAVAESVAMLHKRERMFALIEGASTERPSPTERRPR